jgi:hypothetical protein
MNALRRLYRVSRKFTAVAPRFDEVTERFLPDVNKLCFSSDEDFNNNIRYLHGRRNYDSIVYFGAPEKIHFNPKNHAILVVLMPSTVAGWPHLPQGVVVVLPATWWPIQWWRKITLWLHGHKVVGYSHHAAAVVAAKRRFLQIA